MKDKITFNLINLMHDCKFWFVQWFNNVKVLEVSPIIWYSNYRRLYIRCCILLQYQSLQCT